MHAPNIEDIDVLDEPPFPDPIESIVDEDDVAFADLTRTCTICGGEGEVLTRFAGLNPIGYDYDMARCSTCCGTGIIANPWFD